MSGIGFSWVYSQALKQPSLTSHAMHDTAPFPKGGKPAEAVDASRLGGFPITHPGNHPTKNMHNAAPFPKGGKPAEAVDASRLGGFPTTQLGKHAPRHDTAPFHKGGKPAEVVDASRLGGFLCLQQERLQYRSELKQKARTLRTRMTETEQLLWFHLRRKQIAGVQFFRQRPVGEFILDFYAPSIRLAIEVDGGQHFDAAGLARDRQRTAVLEKFGIAVIRFDNLQVLKETSSVLERIHQIINDRKSPSAPSQALPL